MQCNVLTDALLYAVFSATEDVYSVSLAAVSQTGDVRFILNWGTRQVILLFGLL